MSWRTAMQRYLNRRYTQKLAVTGKFAVALSVAAPVAIFAQDPAPGTSHTYRVEATTEAIPLNAHFTAEQIGLLEKLNRTDRAHIVRLDSLVVPVEWLEDELSYSPLPSWWSWSWTQEKAFVVDVPSQTFGAYEWGRLVRWGPVSTGAQRTPTPPGLFYLTWRSKGHRSSVDSTWYMRWYFNFEPDKGRALHEYALPGRPASHECIRLLRRDAQWLYEWGTPWKVGTGGQVIERGTPVWIIGEYDFGGPPPWRSLEWLARGIVLSEPVIGSTARRRGRARSSRP